MLAVPEEMEKAVREMPRDAEVIELLKKVSAEARFVRDNCKGGAYRMAASRRRFARIESLTFFVFDD